ncbi:ABC transporter substrate-binding protein [Bacillota bacterium Meth-B3]|nr:ABC transporter substrate-binding protein [Christensenellaceae bacterium]
MKKLVVLLLAVLLAIAPFTVLAEGVTLTMGSWRNTDAAMVDALLAKYKELTGVTIVFEPTQSSQYNSVLRLQLDSGTGPDLYYSRSYATGEELYTAGFSMDCSDVAGVKDNFAATSLEPWTAADGKLFAVPFAAVSQPIYYNKTIFADNGITELPQTYEEFIAMCQKLKDNGVTVFANGIASNWDILECVLLGMIPNYIDSKGRVAYETKEKKFNDPQFVEILEDFAKLVPFLPESFEAIDNDNANVYFGMGNAAMLIDGSWSCGPLKDEYDTDWGTMTFPAPAGKTAGVCFHPDMGITGNNATKHPEEVKAFLAWLATPEGAQITADYLPAGFFPMINAPITFKNERVTDILALNQGKTLDARFIWPKMMDYYTPMVEQLNAICRGETTPQAAADTLAALQ